MTTPVGSRTPLDAAELSRLVADFEALYEEKVWQGVGVSRSRHRNDGVPSDSARIDGSAAGGAAPLTGQPIVGRPHWQAGDFRRLKNGMAPADIFDFNMLLPGNVVKGPAVIHTPITTIVLQSGQTGTWTDTVT